MLASYQITYKKAKNLYLDDLWKKINNEDDPQKKIELEREAECKEEEKLSIMCSKYKTWKIINSEKPTARFCHIMKKAKNKVTGKLCTATTSLEQ